MLTFVSVVLRQGLTNIGSNATADSIHLAHASADASWPQAEAVEASHSSLQMHGLQRVQVLTERYAYRSACS